MKAYVITLERSKTRNNYIKQHVADRKLDHMIIPAVDGSLLTDKDLEETCNLEIVKLYPIWLTKGAIGCSLSHLLAYEAFLKTDAKSACIIEDDVILPKNFNEILDEVDKELKSNEIILLYYTTKRTAYFSTVGSVKLSDSGLYYPMDIKQPITSAAYVIGRTAAMNMKGIVKPVDAAADSWEHFYSKGGYESFRVQYPAPVATKNFKSSIDYMQKGSFKQIVTQFIDDHKFPVVYQLLSYLRRRNLNKMLHHFALTDEVSPIYTKLNNNE